MAASDGTSQEKLRGMAANTGFGSIAEDDFPRGPNACKACPTKAKPEVTCK